MKKTILLVLGALLAGACGPVEEANPDFCRGALGCPTGTECDRGEGRTRGQCVPIGTSSARSGGSGGRSSGGAGGVQIESGQGGTGGGGAAGSGGMNAAGGSPGTGGSPGDAGEPDVLAPPPPPADASSDQSAPPPPPPDAGPMCMSICKVGEAKCDDGGARVCVMLNTGCADWSVRAACPAPQTCPSGKNKCECPAGNACATEGVKKCSQGGVSTCQSTGSCLVWSSPKMCGAGESCEQGVCKPQCGAPGYQCCAPGLCNRGAFCNGANLCQPCAAGGACTGEAGQPCGTQRACDAALACAFQGTTDPGICRICGDQDAPCCEGGGAKCGRSNMACFTNPGKNSFCSICGVQDELCCPGDSGMPKCAAGLTCKTEGGTPLCRR
jgi:hypothetical protein